MDYLHIFDSTEKYNEEIGWGYGQMPAVGIIDKNFDEVEDRPTYIKEPICELTYKGPTSNLFHSDFNIKSVSIDGEYVYNNTNERTWKEFTITPDDVSNDNGTLYSVLPDNKMFYTSSVPTIELTVDGGILPTDEYGVIFPYNNEQIIFGGILKDGSLLKDGVVTINSIALHETMGEFKKLSMIVYRGGIGYLTTNVRYFSVDEYTEEVVENKNITPSDTVEEAPDNLIAIPAHGQYVDYMLIEKMDGPFNPDKDFYLEYINGQLTGIAPISELGDWLYDEKTMKLSVQTIISTDLTNAVMLFADIELDENGEIVGGVKFLDTKITMFCKNQPLDSIGVIEGNKTITFEPFNRFAPILLQGTDILTYHGSAFMHNTVNELLPIQFSSCPYLESITLPKSIKNFDFTAINGCNNLKSIICQTKNAPSINSSYSCNDIPNVIVQVPKGGNYSEWEAHPYFIKNNWKIEYV
jgi:hypothetical protein